MVFYSGSREWTVPLSVKEMFHTPEMFCRYVLNFDYMLLDAKGYDNTDLKKFSSRLLGVILILEKTKNNVEFYSRMRDCLDDIQNFDPEERRIFNLCTKIMDAAYGYNKSEEIKQMLSVKNITEVDSMLCDIIENAQKEREYLIQEGKLEGKLEAAINIVKEFHATVTKAMEVTTLPADELEGLINELKHHNIPYTL